MKLSIIIPTYNSSKVICRALDSIVNQTFTDYEVLVMDGMSSDETVKLAESYQDTRIRVFSGPDKGVYDAMNKGIKRSQGEWLYFLGSDDFLVDESVLEKVFHYNLDSFDFVYGDVESIHLPIEHTGQWSIDKIYYNRCHQGIFYRRHIFDVFGLYSLKYNVAADFDLNLKCFLSNKIDCRYIPVIIAHFSEGGLSGDISDIAFYKDFHKLVLVRGWGKMNREQRKYHFLEILNLHKIGRIALSVWRKFPLCSIHCK